MSKCTNGCRVYSSICGHRSPEHITHTKQSAAILACTASLNLSVWIRISQICDRNSAIIISCLGSNLLSSSFSDYVFKCAEGRSKFFGNTCAADFPCLSSDSSSRSICISTSRQSYIICQVLRSTDFKCTKTSCRTKGHGRVGLGWISLLRHQTGQHLLNVLSFRGKLS